MYYVPENAVVRGDARLDNPTIKRLWNSFALESSSLTVTAGEPNTFLLGEATPPTLAEGKEYSLCVDENGVAIIGKDYGGLMRGFMSLLMKIEYDNENIMVKAVTEESDYKIKNRMIHICVFPENDLYFIKKLIRLSALCQYTHIVIEFWGMLQYDCLKELAWPHAFTKDDVRELIRECRELGIEPVPMCNQLGHASASRACYGKHVVLDQNPSLQRLFTPDGWAWNIESDKAKMLLRRIREELYDLFGEGDYMHIGCDEAYFISKNARLRQLFPQYLIELTREVEREGRRPMLWMDMLLDKGVSALDCSVDDQKEVEGIRNSLAPSSVFVDWQYDCTEAPIPSLVSLKDCGRDVIGAPWFKRANYRAHIDTLADNGMYGLMLTTWHTLQTCMQTIVDCAKAYGAATFVWRDSSDMYIETATMLRRISFEGNSYANCGWSKEQINV